MAMGLAAGSWCAQVPQKLSLGVAVGLLDPGACSHCHVYFMDFHVTFSCAWMNLSPSENVLMVIAPPENPPQQMQPPEPKATAVPES